MSLHQLFLQKKALLRSWPIWVGGLMLGTFIQLNWIHSACQSLPFFGAEKVACQDNLLRMLLGGPVFALLFFIGSVFEMKFLLKKYNVSISKNLKDVVMHPIFKAIVKSYYPVLAIIFLPFFNYSDIYLYCIAAIFCVTHVLALTEPKLSPEYGEVFFERLQDDSVAVNFIGKCTKNNEKSIYEIMIECLGILPDVKKLRIMLDNAVIIDARCKSLIKVLVDCATFHSLQTTYVDPKNHLQK